MYPSSIPNGILKVIKWPLALASPILLPFSLMSFWDTGVLEVIFEHQLWVVYGAGIYLVAWYLIFRKQFSGSYFSTFEHELTHALFAWMTFHKVAGLTVTWNEGGECRFSGGAGNWLIMISPYFFPTLVLIPLIASLFLDGQYTEVVQGSIGFLIAYHLTSTWRETHPAQTDLHKAGMAFSWMFLPTANVMIYASVLLYCIGGLESVGDYILNTWGSAWAWGSGFIS